MFNLVLKCVQPTSVPTSLFLFHYRVNTHQKLRNKLYIYTHTHKNLSVYVKDNLRVTYHLEEIGIVMYRTAFVWSY